MPEVETGFSPVHGRALGQTSTPATTGGKRRHWFYLRERRTGTCPRFGKEGIFAGNALKKAMCATLLGSSSLGHFPQYLGIPLGDLRSSLHVLHLSQTPAGLPVIELTPGAERLDRDVILRFRVGADVIDGSLSVYRDPDGAVTGLLTVVPPATLPASFWPRDVVVLLDRSGSMGGWKITAARRATARLLDALTDRVLVA